MREENGLLRYRERERYTVRGRETLVSLPSACHLSSTSLISSPVCPSSSSSVKGTIWKTGRGEEGEEEVVRIVGVVGMLGVVGMVGVEEWRVPRGSICISTVRVSTGISTSSQ